MHLTAMRRTELLQGSFHFSWVHSVASTGATSMECADA